MFKLKDINGKVNYMFRTGKDFVKNDMPIFEAKNIINKGNMLESNVENYPINIDDTWFFEGVEVKKEKKTVEK